VSTNERSGECSIHGSWESYCYSCLTQARSGCVIEALHLYDPSHDLNRIASLEAERDAALAENVALWRVADAAKDVIRFTEPEWRNDVDRGDADTKLAETVATLPPRDVKGEGT